MLLDIWATWCPPCRAMIPHEREMVVIGLSGRGGGKMNHALRDTDVHICVPHERTARIQEVHILTLHCLCDAIDCLLLGVD